MRLYADEGISGTKTKNRKEFLRLMQDAEVGLFDMVVVKDISRFARNTVDLLQNIRRLKALEIETLFLTANMTSMGNSEFVLTIFGALAQEESANTSKRIKFGKKFNAENGRVPNLVYGYDKTPGDYFSLSINQQEADTVRQIFYFYVAEGYGASKIATLLNDRRSRTKRGCAWSQNAICRILTNELYTGKIINGKQEIADFLTGRRTEKERSEWMVTEQAELAIIEPALFEQAQRILRERGQAFRQDKVRQSSKHLFSTLIQCKECGCSFRRTMRTHKNTYIRWVCSVRNGKGTAHCPNTVTLDEDELIATLERYFITILKSKKNLIQQVALEFNRIYKDENENAQLEKELRQKLQRLQKKRQKYMDMYEDDLLSREELHDRIGGMKEESEQLEKSLSRTELNLTKGKQLAGIIQNTFSTIESIVNVREMTNAQLKQVIRKIEVDQNGNVEISLRLLEDLGLSKTALFPPIHT